MFVNFLHSEQCVLSQVCRSSPDNPGLQYGWSILVNHANFGNLQLSITIDGKV